VAICHSREQAEQIRARLGSWLAPRGLSFNEAKTRVVHASDGFDFLGFNVRRYETRQGGKLLIKPSAESLTKVRQRLSVEMRALRGAGPADIVAKLNPIIRGWAAYYRPMVASEAFAKLDNHMSMLTYRWARRRHDNKPWRWVSSRYYGRFNKSRQDKWVFGDRSSGVYLHKFAWTNIVRHTMVAEGASPDDPALTEYWTERRRKRRPPPLAPSTMLRIKAQHGRCPACGEFLLHADDEPQSPIQWEQWFKTIRTAMRRQLIVVGSDGQPNEFYRLVHAYCRTGTDSNCNASTPSRPA
jgi:RNA-directed DNA polymerase